MSSQSKPADPRDAILSESALRELYLECFDECVYNDLPQYLIRISDMRLFAREELWEVFRPLVDTIPIDLESARSTMELFSTRGDWELKKRCKAIIKEQLKFAIFSHRWGVGEPTFRDMSSRIHGERPAPGGSGYRKLLRFCEKAKDYGCDFVWSDTCCINKESSAELDEAIRSVYRWYSDAFVCIAYLAKSSSVDDFLHEPWFTRGWTLQELLAPQRLKMFGKDWNPICPKEKEAEVSPPDLEFKIAYHPNDKKNEFMLDVISKVTGIEAKTIQHFQSEVVYTTVAQKMRWASKRKTTRLEDIAYCLLGIFDVTMSIAYGEGHMAFRRLLEAIAQRHEDITFFAWSGICSPYSSALPSSPASYTTPLTSRYGGDTTFTVQKHGVLVRMLVIRVHFIPSGNRYTLRPVDTGLARQMTIIGHFPEPHYGPKEDYAIGVVNYSRRDRPGFNGESYGLLRAKKHYFCVVMQNPWSGHDIGLISWKVETGGILPMIECQIDYETQTQTICLRHYTPGIWGSL